MFPRDPQLVAEVAGETGARNPERRAAEREMPDVEGLRLLDARKAHAFQDGTGGRPLQRQPGQRIADVAHAHVVEAERAFLEPGRARAAAVEYEAVVRQAEERAVVDDAAGVRAPDRVRHAVDTDARHVAGHHAVQHRLGIAAANLVFLHRADVVGAALVADAEVLVLGVVVMVGELVAVPGAPGVAQVERLLARVERRQQQPLAGIRISGVHAIHRRSRRRAPCSAASGRAGSRGPRSHRRRTTRRRPGASRSRTCRGSSVASGTGRSPDTAG